MIWWIIAGWLTCAVVAYCIFRWEERFLLWTKSCRRDTIALALLCGPLILVVAICVHVLLRGTEAIRWLWKELGGDDPAGW